MTYVVGLAIVNSSSKLYYKNNTRSQCMNTCVAVQSYRTTTSKVVTVASSEEERRREHEAKVKKVQDEIAAERAAKAEARRKAQEEAHRKAQKEQDDLKAQRKLLDDQDKERRRNQKK